MQATVNEFAIAECDIECRDTWPLERLRNTAMAAYVRLEQAGQISICYPATLYADRLSISYESQLPHEWTRALLGEVEKDLILSLKDERDRLADKLNGIIDAMTTNDLLPAFETAAARYNKIQKLLNEEDV